MIAAVILVVGFGAMAPANSAIDQVSTTREGARAVINAVVANPTLVSLVYLDVILATLCIGPAVRPLRRLAPGRGSVWTELGYRLMFVGAIGAAITNAYATLPLPATVGLDRDVMANYIVAVQSSWVAVVLLIAYALLSLGSIVMGVGLLWSRNVQWWLAILFAPNFAAIIIVPIGWPSLVQAVVTGVVLWLLYRRLGASTRNAAPQSA